MKPPRKPSPRAERRADERTLKKRVHDLERAALEAPGGSPRRPIDVPTAALVDTRARSTPCPLCGGELRLDDHAADTIDGARLRIAHVTCASCHRARKLYFRLVGSALN